MANCVVSFTTNGLAISNEVIVEGLPNQSVDGITVDTNPISMTTSGNTYSVILIRKAKYFVTSARFGFSERIFEVPDAATATLTNLLEGLRKAY